MNVTIDKEAEDRLWAFIRAVKVEVGGMGYAFLQDDGSLHWRETFLIPQEVTAGEVDFERTGGDQHAIEKAIEDGVLNDPSFVWVSWHSHHTMEAYWSSTDDKRIEAMNKVGVKRLLSLVGAHDGTYKMRLDVFGVDAHEIDIGQVTVSDLKFAREAQDMSEFEKLIADEVKAHVTEKKYEHYVMGAYDWKGSTLVSSAGEVEDSIITGDKYDDAQAKRRVITELENEGYSYRDASDLVSACGIEDCEDMLWSASQSRGAGS